MRLQQPVEVDDSHASLATFVTAGTSSQCRLDKRDCCQCACCGYSCRYKLKSVRLSIRHVRKKRTGKEPTDHTATKKLGVVLLVCTGIADSRTRASRLFASCCRCE